MARVAVDIDSTLYDFCGLACRVMGELSVKQYEYNDSESAARLRNAAYATSWPEWRTPIDLAGERLWNEVVDICHTPENILKQLPYQGAAKVLDKLHKAGHDLVYVSNRSPSTYEATEAWLADYGFLNGELLCHTEDKLASIRDCQYLIDDRPKTLVGFVTSEWTNGTCGTRKAFGLVTPYNRGLTDVPGIYLAPNWPLLGSYLREKIPSALPSSV